MTSTVRPRMSAWMAVCTSRSLRESSADVASSRIRMGESCRANKSPLEPYYNHAYHFTLQQTVQVQHHYLLRCLRVGCST